MTSEQASEQAAALARADAKTKDGRDLYELRNKFFHLVCRIELRDLRRLASVLDRLDDADLKRVAAFAEGLAEWASGGAE